MATSFHQHFHRRNGRVSFSVTTMLLAFTVVALSLALVERHSKLVQLERENVALRSEYGVTEIEDPSLVYIRQLKTPLPMTWQFHVHSPTNNIVLRSGIYYGENPNADNVRPQAASNLEIAGSFVLTVHVYQDEHGKPRYFANVIDNHAGVISGGSILIRQRVDFDELETRLDAFGQPIQGKPPIESPPSRARSYASNDFIPLFKLNPQPGQSGDLEVGKLVFWLECPETPR